MVGLLLTGMLRAAGPEDALKEAETAFAEGNYAKAVEQYKALLEQGYTGSELLYNLGTAALHASDFGTARLALERALLLDPADPDVLANLEALKKQLPDQFEEVPPFAPVAWWRRLAGMLSTDAWSVLLILLAWLLAGLVFAKMRGLGLAGKPLPAWLLPTGAVVLVLGASLLFTRWKMLSSHKEAVVMVAEVPVTSAPDEYGQELHRLHAGTKVEVLDRIGDFYKVELPNGDTGWLPEEALERI